MADSKGFLAASLAYCLRWELSGHRASKHWAVIREFLDQSQECSEMERWLAELYEESSPSAQEERSIVARLGAYLQSRRAVLTVRDQVLALIPDGLREAAGVHRLMHSLVVPKGYGRIRTWLADSRIARFEVPTTKVCELSAREAEFRQFMALPFFQEGFRRCWRVAPRLRTNRQTRVLLSMSAAISQMVNGDTEDDFALWSNRFGQIGSLTKQSRSDLASLSLAMSSESYDAAELGFRIFVDAEVGDQKNLLKFCEQYEAELNDFSVELVRAMKPIG